MHMNWQLVGDDATSAPKLVALGGGFPVATAGILTQPFLCPAARTSNWLRTGNELTGAVCEQEVTTDLPQAATFLAPVLSGTTALPQRPSPSNAPASTSKPTSDPERGASMSPAVSSAYVAELRKQIAILSKRCARLAAELAASRAAQNPP